MSDVWAQVCGRDKCANPATHDLEFHPCLEAVERPPRLVCASCLRDLRRTFEHGRAIRCRECGTDLTNFSQFVTAVNKTPEGGAR